MNDKRNEASLKEDFNVKENNALHYSLVFNKISHCQQMETYSFPPNFMIHLNIVRKGIYHGICHPFQTQIYHGISKTQKRRQLWKKSFDHKKGLAYM